MSPIVRHISHAIHGMCEATRALGYGRIRSIQQQQGLVEKSAMAQQRAWEEAQAEQRARERCGCVCDAHCCRKERDCLQCLVGRKRPRPYDSQVVAAGGYLSE